MSKEKEILDYLKQMDKKLDKKFLKIEERLGIAEEKAAKQERDIDNIYRILAKLAQDRSTVLKQHGTQYALDSKAVSQVLEDNGYSRVKALRELSEAGYIEHFGDQFSKSVRTEEGYKRAVVINIYN
ncbi:hypothetical protein GND95_08760 [Defluviitalea raffinosedens]|uniref:Uncharacterized protein n=1 Tax=Defluviitalea raffinosedens TaxID=1450156 RepID=A0A7C8LKG2_9FIRM|nr:hypothetical protein [Defluviitalea raffinosedens]KAE9633734.1 hypothetical protein GND95_08760 [Defluviitalea raffinosedens]